MIQGLVVRSRKIFYADRHCSFKGSLILLETCITMAFFTFSSWLFQLVTLVGQLALLRKKKNGRNVKGRNNGMSCCV